MDEPTAGVDAASQDVLAQVLQRLVERGVTMLVVTHDLSVLHQVVTRIVAMEAGSVAFDGDPEDYTAYLGAMITGRPINDHHHDPRPGVPPLMKGPSDGTEEGHRHG